MLRKGAGGLLIIKQKFRIIREKLEFRVVAVVQTVQLVAMTVWVFRKVIQRKIFVNRWLVQCCSCGYCGCQVWVLLAPNLPKLCVNSKGKDICTNSHIYILSSAKAKPCFEFRNWYYNYFFIKICIFKNDVNINEFEDLQKLIFTQNIAISRTHLGAHTYIRHLRIHITSWINNLDEGSTSLTFRLLITLANVVCEYVCVVQLSANVDFLRVWANEF